MKKVLSIIAFLLILLVFTGCNRKPYSFKNPVDEIESIEIVSAKNSFDFTVIKTLSEEEKDDFLEQFQEIQFGRYLFGDPVSLHGNAVKITYQTGDYEMICSFWADYIKDGKRYFLWKYCNEKDFDKLLDSFLE